MNAKRIIFLSGEMLTDSDNHLSVTNHLLWYSCGFNFQNYKPLRDCLCTFPFCVLLPFPSPSVGVRCPDKPCFFCCLIKHYAFCCENGIDSKETTLTLERAAGSPACFFFVSSFSSLNICKMSRVKSRKSRDSKHHVADEYHKWWHWFGSWLCYIFSHYSKFFARDW